MNIKYILLALLIIIILLLIYCLLNRKTEGFKELKKTEKPKIKLPLMWQKFNNEELLTLYKELKNRILRKLQVDADERGHIKQSIDKDYIRDEMLKITQRKVQLESLVRSLDDWNKKFDSTELEKTSKIEEIDMKIEELERNKSAISSNLESKKELYMLNNFILQLI